MKKTWLLGVFLLLAVCIGGNAVAADRVVVIPLNTCGDKNLLPENISFGVTICGVTGKLLPDGQTVVSNTGRIWMDRNLGASQVATSSTDTLGYGDLYQWGRGTDGHEKRTSGVTSVISTSATPPHSDFITSSITYNYDWLTPQNNTLWQGVAGINNPCPSGFRLPTDAEWDHERLSWSSNNAVGAFASSLKLVVAGYRLHSSGSPGNVGGVGYYWSSTVDGTNSRNSRFNSTSAYMNSSYRADGFSVRCLKD